MFSKKLLYAIIIIAVILFFFLFVGCERIDAGNVSIKVNNAGDELGVSKSEYVTG